MRTNYAAKIAKITKVFEKMSDQLTRVIDDASKEIDRMNAHIAEVEINRDMTAKELTMALKQRHRINSLMASDEEIPANVTQINQAKAEKRWDRS